MTESLVPTLDLSVVVPMFNEASTIPLLIDRVRAACSALDTRWELVLVDDGSSDETLTVARRAAESDAHIVVVELARNFGQHAAVMAGFQSARGRAVVTLDADLQNPPEEIPRIFEALRTGHDIVHTYRIDRDDSWGRRFASKITNRIARALAGTRITDYGCMLRGYSFDVARACVESNDRRTFIPALADHLAGHPIEIGVGHEARTHGDSKYSLIKLLGLQLDLVTSLSVRPLRLLTVVGLLLAAGGLTLGFLLISLRLAFGVNWANEGTLTILGIVSILAGAQLIAIGVLGEYIGRIHERLSGRSSYRVRAVHHDGRRRSTSEPPTDDPDADLASSSLRGVSQR
ncbi:MAG: glycosyltransferase [Planctomycetes bacterium]|nr:glycosyltransferase [Planctomycetota bacterium]